jgi:hypothetical protein
MKETGAKPVREWYIMDIHVSDETVVPYLRSWRVPGEQVISWKL